MDPDYQQKMVELTRLAFCAFRFGFVAAASNLLSQGNHLRFSF